MANALGARACSAPVVVSGRGPRVNVEQTEVASRVKRSAALGELARQMTKLHGTTILSGLRRGRSRRIGAGRTGPGYAGADRADAEHAASNGAGGLVPGGTVSCRLRGAHRPMPSRCFGALEARLGTKASGAQPIGDSGAPVGSGQRIGRHGGTGILRPRGGAFFFVWRRCWGVGRPLSA